MCAAKFGQSVILLKCGKGNAMNLYLNLMVIYLTVIRMIEISRRLKILSSIQVLLKECNRLAGRSYSYMTTIIHQADITNTTLPFRRGGRL